MDNNRYDVLMGGIQVGPCREFPRQATVISKLIFGETSTSVGTLGILLRDANYNIYLLSNYHVLCVDNLWSQSPEVSQPGAIPGELDNCGPGGVNYVGDVVAAKLFSGYGTADGVGVDAAIARLAGPRANPNHYRLHTVLGQGDQPVIINGIAPLNTLEIGQRVWKRGMASGYTVGRIRALQSSGAVDFGHGNGTVDLRRQISVIPDAPDFDLFCESGDSGSLVVTLEGNLAVGLLWASSEWGYSDLDNAMVTPIQSVLNAFLPLQLFL